MKSLPIEKNTKIILIAFSGVFLILTLILFQFTVDDSFITYRYAKNLIANGTWNWNPTGGTVEEAYTNFLYAILAIVPEYLKINTLIFFKLIGVLSIIYLAVRLFYLIENKTIYFVSLAFLVLNPFFYIHAYSGLETPIFIILIFELIVVLSKNKKAHNEKIFYFVLLLLPLTRPEGALYSLVGFFLFWYKTKTIQSKNYFIIILLIGIGYFILRYIYFGQLFPNTFYVKSTQGFDIQRFVNFSFQNIKYWSVFLLFIIIKDKSYRALLGTSVIINIVLYANSIHQMNFADRFSFQTLAPFYLAAFIYIKDKYNFFIVSVIIAFLLGMIFEEENLIDKAKEYPELRQSHGELGVALSKYKNDNLSLMVGDAGLIPYFSEWYVYDFIGLANKHIAHNGVSFEYLQKANPDLILLYSSLGAEKRVGYNHIYAQDLIETYISKSKSYTFVGSVKLNDNFFLLAFLKSDLKKFDEIKYSIKSIEMKTSDFKINKIKYILQYYLTYPAI
jgi:hypothetical protein